MTRVTGAVAIALVVGGLAACGGGGTTGVERTPGGSPSAGAAGVRIAVVAATGPAPGAAPGGIGAPADRLAGRALRDYLAALRPAQRSAAQAAIDGLAVSAGESLYAQVVHVGCRRAGEDTVTVTRHGDEVRMTSTFREPKDTECFAPVSTTAFAAVPD